MLQQLRVFSSGNTQLVSIQIYYDLVVRLVNRPRQSVSDMFYCYLCKVRVVVAAMLRHTAVKLPTLPVVI